MEQMQITHSEELYSRAKELMPGGSRSPGSSSPCTILL